MKTGDPNKANLAELGGLKSINISDDKVNY